MRILVTGGAGFIGSLYVRTLLTGGYPGFGDASVTVLDKLTYAGNLANLQPVSGSPQFEFIQGDICDASLLRSVLPGHDVVINFAAETHVDRSIAGATEFTATNVVGVQVSRCHRCGRRRRDTAQTQASGSRQLCGLGSRGMTPKFIRKPRCMSTGTP
jgi:dTDP-glucose 4,6-dehydratase